MLRAQKIKFKKKLFSTFLNSKANRTPTSVCEIHGAPFTTPRYPKKLLFFSRKHHAIDDIIFFPFLRERTVPSLNDVKQSHREYCLVRGMAADTAHCTEPSVAVRLGTARLSGG